MCFHYRATKDRYNSKPSKSILNYVFRISNTSQKMKFSLRDYFCKCYQICRILRIWSHLRKRSLMENFIFCAVVFMPTCNDPLPKMTKIVMYRYVNIYTFLSKVKRGMFLASLSEMKTPIQQVK